MMVILISTEKTDLGDDCIETTNPPYNITITSTLTVFNATSKETGYYSCAKSMLPSSSSYPSETQYIYVKG